MKKFTYHFPALACVALATLFAFQTAKTSAQIFAQDDAGAYTNWTDGMNLGVGFGPWTLDQTGTFPPTSYTGFFIGHAGSIGSGSGSNNAWGIYANGSSGTNAAVAFRSFTNSLQTGTVFKIKWQTYGISPINPDALGGLCLRNGNATNSTDDYLTGYRFVFYYVGADVDSFLIWDGAGITVAGLPFSSNPFQIEFTLLTADTYRLVIKNAAGVILTNFDNMTLAASGTIDSVSLFALQTDGDQVFNSMQISSTSLIPPDIANLQPADGTTYASPATPFSFDVSSFYTAIPANGIRLVLNGANQTNLTFTGGGTTNVHVVLNTSLQNNVLYAGTITATDANGNHATNNFSFNTWSSYNPFIEAEDYNFSAGAWIDNFLAPQPNQSYAGLFGTNGIDYLEYDLTGTNPPNPYRPGDLPQLEVATDVDHANFVAAGITTSYDLAYIQNGEWEDYTRRMSNATYAVYARMSGFGANPVMLMERTAAAIVTSSNQPRAALGTFVCPNTGAPQNWTFVPLNDFFSNPVLVNFPGTNTFRFTCIGSDGSYNFYYLILVPSTNAATLRPYLASGFPYPGATGVGPDQLMSFTIANRQTAVSPGTIQLFLNSSNVTGSLQLSNNAAGTVVSYQSPTLLTAGTNTLQVIFSDGTVSQTNQWPFTVAALPVIPTAYAYPVGIIRGSGFSLLVAKADDSATNTDFPPSVARAEAQLAGTLTNSTTLQPYPNLALNNGLYIETNVINYGIDAEFTGLFASPAAFPDIPSGTTNNVAMQALMYVQLSPGVYSFGVTSDDGFKFTTGPTPASTNLTLGIADYGRAASETAFAFIVQTNGLYPMRLLCFKSQLGGGGVELYSINRTDGTRILLNDPTNPNSIKVFWGVPLSIQRSGNNVVVSWNDASLTLQSAPRVTGVYTNIAGATSPYTSSITGPQKYYRLIH